MNRSEADMKQVNNAYPEEMNLARFLKLMGDGGDGKAMWDELAGVEREIAASERGDYGEGPLWLREIPEPAVPA